MFAELFYQKNVKDRLRNPPARRAIKTMAKSGLKKQ
jgi:hypothetical protein